MRSILTLVSAIAIALLASGPTQAGEPDLRRVLLSTGGVGYFGFDALPDSEGRVRLTVPLAQVDDVLKSLTVLGGDGQVRSVSLPGPTPLADLFRDAPFGEDDLADLPSLLLRLRGAEIEVSGPAKLRGRILAVAREEVVEDGRATVRHRLSLAAAGGVSSVVLETVESLAFTDPVLQQRVGTVLARLAENSGERTRELELSLDSRAEGQVTLGYLAETPVWKASWRLVAGEADGLLQGWAILENASGREWRDVEITLIAGSPRAMQQALFARRYVERPEFGATLPLAPAAERALAAAPAPDVAMAKFGGAAALDTGAAQELSAQTLFPLAEHVSLAPGRTAMAPIVDRKVPIERVALYRTGEGNRHPSAALRLRNDTGASLPSGLATLYEALPTGGLTFLGDAPLPQTAPGRTEMLAYGRDGAVDVAVRDETHARIDRAKLVDGVLEITKVEQQRWTYAVDLAPGATARSFVLEQPRWTDWHVTEPADAAIEGEVVRIIRPLAAGAPLEIAVTMEQPQSSRVSLLDFDLQAVELELAGAEPPPALRDALARLRELSGRVVTAEGDIKAAEQRRDEVVGDQERLRENLAAVPANSDLSRRYLAALAASEDELAAIGTRLDGLRADLGAARSTRAAYVRGLQL